MRNPDDVDARTDHVTFLERTRPRLQPKPTPLLPEPSHYRRELHDQPSRWETFDLLVALGMAFLCGIVANSLLRALVGP